MQVNPSSAQDILAIEQRLSEKFAKKQKKLFGTSGAAIRTDDPRYEEFKAYINDRLKNFPKTENGSQFVNVKFHVRIKVAMDISKQGLFIDQIQVEGNLPPIWNRIYGQVHAGNEKVCVSKIKLKNEESEGLGAFVIGKTIKLEASQSCIEGTATVIVGDKALENVPCEYEPSSQRIIVPLLQVTPLEGRIDYNGIVHLGNKMFQFSQVKQSQGVKLINCTHEQFLLVSIK